MGMHAGASMEPRDTWVTGLTTLRVKDPLRLKDPSVNIITSHDRP